MEFSGNGSSWLVGFTITGCIDSAVKLFDHSIAHVKDSMLVGNNGTWGGAVSARHSLARVEPGEAGSRSERIVPPR